MPKLNILCTAHSFTAFTTRHDTPTAPPNYTQARHKANVFSSKHYSLGRAKFSKFGWATDGGRQLKTQNGEYI